jgi:hypothetical protein
MRCSRAHACSKAVRQLAVGTGVFWAGPNSRDGRAHVMVWPCGCGPAPVQKAASPCLLVGQAMITLAERPRRQQTTAPSQAARDAVLPALLPLPVTHCQAPCLPHAEQGRLHDPWTGPRRDLRSGLRDYDAVGELAEPPPCLRLLPGDSMPSQGQPLLSCRRRGNSSGRLGLLQMSRLTCLSLGHLPGTAPVLLLATARPHRRGHGSSSSSLLAQRRRRRRRRCP